MKKIITSLGMIVFVGAIVVGGTGAFFSDTETASGNIFTAGSLDLKVDSVAHINGLVCHDDGQGNRWIPNDQVVWNPETPGNELIQGANVPAAIIQYNNKNPANVPKAGETCGGTWALTDLGPTHTFFNYGDLKPGDSGENTISLHVFDNDAYMCAIIHNVESNENGCTAPEIAAGDTSCGLPGIGEGELHEEIRFFIWEDDGDNIYQQGEKILVQNATAEDAGGVYPLYTPETNTVFPGGETKYLGVYWCYGEFELNGTNLSCDGAPVTNMTQTDSLEADISFYIEQARHNDNFTCPTVTPLEEPVVTRVESPALNFSSTGWGG